MIALSSQTAAAIALHAAEGSWIVFLQAIPPNGGSGPVRIEGIAGKRLADRLTTIARDNAYDVQLIGMMPTVFPEGEALQICHDFEQAHLRDGWFEPASYIMSFVQNSAQQVLQQLLDQTHPGGLSDEPVSIDEMAQILDVAVVTIRRMIKAGEIPFMKFGRVYRFVPADVIASLSR